MTTRFISTEQARGMAIKLLQSHALPCTMTITKGVKRSIEQNKTQRLWIKEAAEQLQDQSTEDYRGYCKLHFGVPILRNEDDEFKAIYDEVIRPLQYEQKIKCMMVPIDMPVTSRMTTRQKKQYLDAIWHYFTGLGVVLTNPEDRRYGTPDTAYHREAAQ